MSSSAAGRCSDRRERGKIFTTDTKLEERGVFYKKKKSVLRGVRPSAFLQSVFYYACWSSWLFSCDVLFLGDVFHQLPVLRRPGAECLGVLFGC